jgi:hypothetical protein
MIQTIYVKPTPGAIYFIMISLSPILGQAKILLHDRVFRRKRTKQEKLASAYNQIITSTEMSPF